MLTVKQIKEQLQNIPDDYEVYIRCVRNPCGNIIEVKSADKSKRSFFGKSIDCVIIEPDNKITISGERS